MAVFGYVLKLGKERPFTLRCHVIKRIEDNRSIFFKTIISPLQGSTCKGEMINRFLIRGYFFSLGVSVSLYFTGLFRMVMASFKPASSFNCWMILPRWK